MKTLSVPKRDFTILLCLAFITHLGLWIYGQLSPEIRKTNDSGEYLLTAENLLTEGVIYSGKLEDQTLKPALFSKRPPVYPAFIAFLSPISDDPGIVALAQVLLNFLCAYLLWEILGYLEVSRKLRVITVALYLFYPAQLIYTQLIMAEILFQGALLASFFFLVRFRETGQWQDSAYCHILLGLSALTKPIMVYFWLPNLLYQAWLAHRLRKPKMVFLALIPLFFVTLWSYRNYLHTGYFHFSSIKTSNMMYVNIPGMVRRTEGADEARTAIRELRRRADSAQSFAEASRTVEHAFLRTVFRNPGTVIRSYARGSLFFFLDPGRFDLYEFLDLPHDIRGFQFLKGSVKDTFELLEALPPYVLPYFLLVGTINLLLLAGFIYCALSARYPLELRLFALILVGYTLLIVGPTGLSRFRLGIYPFLVLALPPLLARLAEAFKTSRLRRQN